MTDATATSIAPAQDRDDALAMAAMTLAWHLAGGHPHRDGFLDEFADAWMAQREHRPCWLARDDDGNPVGFVTGALVRGLPSLRRPTGGWLHLSACYVVPSARGAGLGERLLRTVVGWCEAEGLYRVQLNAADLARPLYRRVGFGGPQDTLMQLVLTDRAPGSA